MMSLFGRGRGLRPSVVRWIVAGKSNGQLESGLPARQTGRFFNFLPPDKQGVRTPQCFQGLPTRERNVRVTPLVIRSWDIGSASFVLGPRCFCGLPFEFPRLVCPMDIDTSVREG